MVSGSEENPVRALAAAWEAATDVVTLTQTLVIFARQSGSPQSE